MCAIGTYAVICHLFRMMGQVLSFCVLPAFFFLCSSLFLRSSSPLYWLNASSEPYPSWVHDHSVRVVCEPPFLSVADSPPLCVCCVLCGPPFFAQPSGGDFPRGSVEKDKLPPPFGTCVTTGLTLVVSLCEIQQQQQRPRQFPPGVVDFRKQIPLPGGKTPVFTASMFCLACGRWVSTRQEPDNDANNQRACMP